MAARLFISIREDLVRRFEAQVADAWQGATPPSERDQAVPHRCEECDELWAMLGRMSMDRTDEVNLNWFVPLDLFAPPAIAFLIGFDLLHQMQRPKRLDWAQFERAIRLNHLKPLEAEKRFWDIYECLSPRQRWCLLKALVWTYRQTLDAEVMTGIRRLRAAMGYHEPWPNPRPFPQT